MAARSGYLNTKSGSLSASPSSQHWDFHTNILECDKFLGSQSWGASNQNLVVQANFRQSGATTKSYTVNVKMLVTKFGATPVSHCYMILLACNLLCY